MAWCTTCGKRVLHPFLAEMVAFHLHHDRAFLGLLTPFSPLSTQICRAPVRQESFVLSAQKTRSHPLHEKHAHGISDRSPRRCRTRQAHHAFYTQKHPGGGPGCSSLPLAFQNGCSSKSPNGSASPEPAATPAGAADGLLPINWNFSTCTSRAIRGAPFLSVYSRGTNSPWI